MGNMVKNIYVKFNYNQLGIDKALGNFRKLDNNKKKKKNVCSAWRPFPGPKQRENYKKMQQKSRKKKSYSRCRWQSGGSEKNSDGNNL